MKINRAEVEKWNFLPRVWNLITLERLFQNLYGQSLYMSIFRIQGTEARARFLAEQVEQTTGLKDFGSYLSRVLTIDALFLNEDRHMHNIAVLNDGFGNYHYCPVFDNGCALLSDTQMEYPTVVPGLLTAIDRRKMKNSEKIV